MPIRIGFAKFRQKMLEQELGNIIEMLPQLGIEKAILMGDMVTGDYSPDSRIELVIIQKTESTFGRRADFFSYHLNSTVAVDTQIFTPEEFESLRNNLPSLQEADKRGRVIFDG
jgi:hypothetical protein